MLAIQRIVAAIDFSDVSDAALDYAVEFASKLGAKVTVMHAYEIPVMGFPDGVVVATPDMARRVSEAAKNGLDVAIEARKGRGVELTPVLREGVTWEEVNKVADQVDADLIVIGTHGRRGLARALLGSVAENVIRTSTRPVLTVHGHPPAR